MPERQFRYREERENRHHDHCVSDDGRTMNAAAGPEVVDDDQHWKGEDHGECDIDTEAPTIDRGTENRHGAEDHEALVGGRVAAREERPRRAPTR